MKDKEMPICVNCIHAYVCEEYNLNRDMLRKKCAYHNDHFVDIKHYQPKLPKDSVVLSRDNYNRLKRDSDLFEELLKKKVHLETVIELSNAQYEKVLEENKSLERLLSLIDDLPKEQLLDLDKHLETLKSKERKETAEKILKKGEEFYKMSYHKSNAIHRLAEWIKDNFGVEIKD